MLQIIIWAQELSNSKPIPNYIILSLRRLQLFLEFKNQVLAWVIHLLMAKQQHCTPKQPLWKMGQRWEGWLEVLLTVILFLSETLPISLLAPKCWGYQTWSLTVAKIIECWYLMRLSNRQWISRAQLMSLHLIFVKSNWTICSKIEELPLLANK